MRSSQGEELGKGSLIKDGDMVQATTQIQTVAATDMGLVPRERKIVVGKMYKRGEKIE